jgi:protein-disulfide isomerase
MLFVIPFRSVRVLAILVLGVILLPSCGRSSRGPVSPDSKPASTTSGGDRIPITADDAVLGSPTAYVTWVVFADFRGPICKELSSGLDRVREVYPPDVLRIVWKHRPSPNLVQAKLASTVGQGVFALGGAQAFWRYRDLAFRERENITSALIRQWALATGVRGEELDAGLEHGAWADKVERDAALATKLGVTEAPVSFVNGVQVPGAPALDVLRNLIDVELAKAKVLEQSGVPRANIYAQAVAANSPLAGSAAGGSELDDPKAVWRVRLGASPVRGKSTAPVTIVAFSDFACVPCKRAAETLERIRAAYGDGVRFVWKDAPPPAHSRISPAAYLARAARAQKGDAGFWDMYDRLFALAKLEDVDLEMAAQAAGLDVKAAMAAVRGQVSKKEVEADLELAEDIEVTVPPQFFVNGRRLIGDPSYEKLRAVVDEEVKKADALLHSGIEPTALYDWFIKDGLPGEPISKSVPFYPNAPFKGPVGAPIVVQEFSESPCGPCAQADPMLDDLVKAFPGMVKVLWRDLPTLGHIGAPLAAQGAREAFAEKGNDGFWAIRGRMALRPKSLTREDLEQCAGEVGLDGDKFRKALDARVYSAVVEADEKVAADVGIVSTPTFVVGSYILRGLPSFARLSRLVRRAISELPPPKPTTPSPSGPVRFSIVDLVVGKGPPAQAGNDVTIHYRGKLLNGAEFDSTSRRGAFSFTLGAGNVIQAWDRGIVGMRVGGRRRLTVPPELAYGNHGLGSSIPPNAVVVFEVELVGIQ